MQSCSAGRRGDARPGRFEQLMNRVPPEGSVQPNNQFQLLRERRFAPFFGVQFLGALNDNVFKQALIIMLAFQTASFTTMSTDVLQNLAQALFVLPFFVFSATAGQLAVFREVLA